MRRHLFINIFLFIFCFSMSAQQHSDIPTASTSDFTQPSATSISISDSVINYGKLFLNRPYRYGSSGDSTFDCSGFTSFVYKKFGYALKRSSSEQAEQFETVDTNELKPGDLVYYSGHKRSKRVGHVGMVVSNNGNGQFDFIHASVQSGVVISNSEEKYYSNRFIKANRVIASQNDFMAKMEIVSIANNSTTSTLKKEEKHICAKYHSVCSGETLSSIAKRNGVTVSELKNNNNLKNNNIRPGQKLKIKDENTEYQNLSAEENTKKKTIETLNDSSFKKGTQISTKDYSIHSVKKGESLFSISNKYNVSIDELKDANKLPNNKLFVGQKIKVTQDKKAIETNATNNTPSTHTVKSGETLFSIAKTYNVSIDDIKRGNDLKTNNIIPNQKLKIVCANNQNNSAPESTPAKTKIHKVRSGETFYSIALKYGCKIETLKEWNNKSGSKLSVGETLVLH